MNLLRDITSNLPSTPTQVKSMIIIPFPNRQYFRSERIWVCYIGICIEIAWWTEIIGSQLKFQPSPPKTTHFPPRDDDSSPPLFVQVNVREDDWVPQPHEKALMSIFCLLTLSFNANPNNAKTYCIEKKTSSNTCEVCCCLQLISVVD